MTLNQFITKWNGKYLEVAGSSNALNQCVDLANGYIRDVLGLSIIEWTNAVDFPSKAGDSYDWIPNTPTGIPKEGDIVVWKPSPGHIAVFIEGNIDRFKSFDENFPIGSPCHIQDHNYTNVTGWLRKKVVSDASTQVEIDQLRTDRDRNWTWFTAVCEALGVGANVEVAVAEAKKLVGLDDALVHKDKELQEANTQITDLQGKYDELNDKYIKVVTEGSLLTEKVVKQEKKIHDFGNEMAYLEDALETLKAQATAPITKGWRKIIIDFILKT